MRNSYISNTYIYSHYQLTFLISYIYNAYIYLFSLSTHAVHRAILPVPECTDTAAGLRRLSNRCRPLYTGSGYMQARHNPSPRSPGHSHTCSHQYPNHDTCHAGCMSHLHDAIYSTTVLHKCYVCL